MPSKCNELEDFVELDEHENFKTNITSSTENNDQMKVKRRIIAGPWKNVAEFKKVYCWLYGPDSNTESRKLALSQMRVWGLRRSTQCPAAILGTSVMVEVQLKDEAASIANNDDLQMLYASAFTRFFNFMSSIMQTYSIRNMYDTAKDLGLASFVVDLRHICAHGQVLPPLEVLRNTAQYCLHWLRDYYWNTQRANMCDVDAAFIRRKDKTQCDLNISRLFEVYDSALEVYMGGVVNIKIAKRYLHGHRLQCLKEYYNLNKFKTLTEIFDHIVQKLGQLIKRDIAIKDITEVFVEAILKMKYFFNVYEKAQNSDKHLEMLLEVTQTLFRMLALYDMLEKFFEAVLDIAESVSASDERKSGASFWAIQISKGFKAYRKCKELYKKELDKNPNIQEVTFSSTNVTKLSHHVRELLICSGIDRRYTLILSDTMRRPWIWSFDRSYLEKHLQMINKYTVPVIKRLLYLIEPELTVDEMQAFCSLIEAYFEVPTETNMKDNSKIYTPQDLLNKINGVVAETMEVDNDEHSLECEESTENYGLWSIAPVINTVKQHAKY
ncbi:uncharacterized protein LOC119631730 isoform X3 [Glossina fuscipes]|uniref:Uncharacterized protein LOC119631730 isoform X3 n=1 Tax=Glossina fuscipes TaxID=7396 RepID=A0A8U0W4K9_9MUSC|nr:uncharacterized protein LOC119631730 isoform X3 [Glossina fuscipes]